jgi:hypothetical protein
LPFPLLLSTGERDSCPVWASSDLGLPCPWPMFAGDSNPCPVGPCGFGGFSCTWSLPLFTGDEGPWAAGPWGGEGVFCPWPLPSFAGNVDPFAAGPWGGGVGERWTAGSRSCNPPEGRVRSSSCSAARRGRRRRGRDLRAAAFSFATRARSNFNSRILQVAEVIDADPLVGCRRPSLWSSTGALCAIAEMSQRKKSIDAFPDCQEIIIKKNDQAK